MNARAQRAKQIMETQSHCSQIDANTFSVRSQTNPENRYMVRETANGLVCECPITDSERQTANTSRSC